MTTKKTYAEKLRDPRWQKKRLEIMERDSFLCRVCFDKDKTLNVHHRYYEKNKAPWDYENEALITLCEECHERVHKAQEKLNKFFSRMWITDCCSIVENKFCDFDIAQSIVAAVVNKETEQLSIQLAIARNDFPVKEEA